MLRTANPTLIHAQEWMGLYLTENRGVPAGCTQGTVMLSEPCSKIISKLDMSVDREKGHSFGLPVSYMPHLCDQKSARTVRALAGDLL